MGTKTQKLSNVVDQIVEWQSVFTGDGSTGLTAVAGRGYFIDTTSGTVTVTLPTSPKAGDIVQLKDYARTWGTNAVTISSTTFDGISNNPSFSTNGQTVTLVYMDGTKGWSLINEDTTTGLGAQFIAATGGTVTESGDFKIHTFTGDGCFVVSSAGNPAGSSSVDYLVVAGGGGGTSNSGTDTAGAGGGGGYRESSGAASGCYTVSPLGACVSALPVSATTYPVTVGAGGSGGIHPARATSGSNSVFSTITSTGGGSGGNNGADTAGDPGGSGGGAGGGGGLNNPGGSGNTPPVSPPQGSNGGNSTSSPPDQAAGGGGGATEAGVQGSGPPDGGGRGGAGATTSISNSPLSYSGGGGSGGGLASPCGTGGAGGSCTAAGAGTTNRGGGGGGTYGHPTGGAGGKGIVIIRYKFQ